jgi:2-dehydro-3-deoxy-D-gluconate 5-dehydrogenase
MILDLFKLDGRAALVTGASRGIGQALAYGLAQAGADIACVTRSGEATETRRLVESCGRKFVDLKADLGKADERDGLARKVVDELGRLDILVNNAGVTHRHLPEEYPVEEWRYLLEVHLHAAFELAVQAAEFMAERGRGKIINIGSLMCYEAGLNVSAYASAKHALAGLTKSLAVSWASRGINVNCIAPGYIETELSGVLQDDPVRGPQILERIPLGRWAQPDELAGLCVYLASDASSYMHGSVIPIDGGWLSR